MDADILEYYERGGEDTRLADSIELLRTKELLRRYLPPASDVLDVGGASGVYATWLTAQGHRVNSSTQSPGTSLPPWRRASTPCSVTRGRSTSQTPVATSCCSWARSTTCSTARNEFVRWLRRAG
ncbi:MAG TPA: hypothetical protein VF106_10620 [Actinophytocola sp.]